MSASLRLHSLKLRLLFPYAILIALLTGVIGSATYMAGASTVTALADRTLEQMAARLQQTIERHVSGSAAALEAAFPTGMAASADIRQDWLSLRRRLWAATTLYPINDYVYYGNLAGQNVGLKRLADGTAVVRIRRSENAHRDLYTLDSIDGRGSYVGSEQAMFDPRERPWFQMAAQTDSHVWTPVYVDFNQQDLVLTRARRVLNGKGEFEGVVATDVSLSALSRVVNELGRSIDGYAFVLEPDGDVVAASNIKSVRLTETGAIDRVTVSSSGDEILTRIYTQLRDHHISSNEPSQALLEMVHKEHLQALDGSPLHVAFVRIRDTAGLDWIAGVALPRATMLEDVSKLVIWVLLAGGLAFVLALLIGMHLFGRVADDIHALSLAVQRIGQGDVHTHFETRRTDEVGQLARTFSQMRQDLFTDKLTGIPNRSALRHQLTRMTTSSIPDMELPPFAVLFIDLDWFKPLNDQWGHDNGDRALKEIAQRLQSHIRREDYVARLGGDEFVVVLQDIDHLEAAQVVSNHLEQLISAPLTTLQGIPPEQIVHVGASIGIALYPQDGATAQTLLKLADQHMYDKKGHQHHTSSATGR